MGCVVVSRGMEPDLQWAEGVDGYRIMLELDMTQWSVWPGEDTFFILLLLDFKFFKNHHKE